MIKLLLLCGFLNLLSIYLYVKTVYAPYIFLTCVLTILILFISLSIRVINKPKEDLLNQIEDAKLKAIEVRNEINRLTSIIKYQEDLKVKYAQIDAILNSNNKKDTIDTIVKNNPLETDTYILNSDSSDNER